MWFNEIDIYLCLEATRSRTGKGRGGVAPTRGEVARDCYLERLCARRAAARRLETKRRFIAARGWAMRVTHRGAGAIAQVLQCFARHRPPSAAWQNGRRWL